MRGTKTGGRVRGTPNRATVQRRLEIARQLDDARNHGRPLAKDRIEEAMELARELMYERLPSVRPVQDGARPVYEQGDTFGAWFDRFVHAAAQLSRYQSPTLRALAVTDATMQRPPLNLDRRPRAADQTGEHPGEGHLLPRTGRAVRDRLRGQPLLQQPEGCWRQLHCAKKLRFSAAAADACQNSSVPNRKKPLWRAFGDAVTHLPA
jgi:hypothetical protein